MDMIEKIREQIGINIDEDIKRRNEFIDYLKKLRDDNIEEYKKIMADFVSDDYGVIISPKSFAGKVYKYDSGVIGIDASGNKEEINIDETTYDHSSATIRIGCLLNKNFNEKYMNRKVLVTPYEIGTILSDYGILLIQLEGDSMFIYLPPNELTDIQNILLQNEIEVRNNMFKIKYIKNMKELDSFDPIRK